MKLEEVLPALREGKVIRLQSRPERAYHLKADEIFCIEYKYESDYLRHQMDTREILAWDWEIVE